MKRLVLLGCSVVLATGVLFNQSEVRAARADARESVAVTSARGATGDCIILLHGLARTAASMSSLADALVASGHSVANVDYPSRHFAVETLATVAVPAGIDACLELQADTLHVVTHSLGGILVRQFIADADADADADALLTRLGRVIMLAPPNHGSEVVDAMHDVPGFQWLNGPAGSQLGTNQSSVPRQLGPVDIDVAVIAGNASINPILSSYLPNPDDGKVSVASTRLEGMCAMLVMDVSHPFIMRDDDVIAEVLSYLSTGRLIDERAEYPPCPARATQAHGSGSEGSIDNSMRLPSGSRQ